MSDANARPEIVRVATRMFARQGFAGTSLQSIATEVGIRKPSVLYHFSSKKILREAVLNELLAHWNTRLPEILAVATSGTHRFTALMDEVINFFRADPNRALLIMREVVDRPNETKEKVGLAIRPWFHLLTQAIREGQQAGRVRSSVNPEAFLVECIVMIVGCFVAADFAGADFPATNAVNRLTEQLTEIHRIAATSLFIQPPNSSKV